MAMPTSAGVPRLASADIARMGLKIIGVRALDWRTIPNAQGNCADEDGICKRRGVGFLRA
jgi:hypothetical protein